MESLTEFQKNILNECLRRDKCGISLPMGSGKTLISIVLGLERIKNTDQKILVICAKNLIMNWRSEITKFFSDSLESEIVHSDHVKLDTWKIKDSTKLVLTTPEVLVKGYTQNMIANSFIVDEQMNNMVHINHYMSPTEPYLNHTIGVGLFYTIRWGCLIIDEAQNYTKISTKKCQALCTICSKYRYLLSGTMFNEPVTERIFGYHMLLDYPGFPRNLPDAKRTIRNNYLGLNRTLVYRKTNENFILPTINEHIVVNELNKFEEKIYVSLKDVLKKVNARANYYKSIGDKNSERTFSTYKLCMIMYLRQNIISPIIPITSAMIDIADFRKKSDLSKIMLKELEEKNLMGYLNDEKSLCSSRIKKIQETIEKHKNEKIILFTNFRSTLRMIQYNFEKITKRELFTLESKYSMEKRNTILEKYKNTENGILLLTYSLGSEGLNLQCANTVLLADFWWNNGTTKQAIARVLRYGQKSTHVNIYHFMSNTGIEKAIFEKHSSKLKIVEELKQGPIRSTVKGINTKDIIRLIDKHENIEILNQLIN